MNDPPVTASLPLLLPEALGFSPQLLLDDIINVANNAVQDGVNGMEEFLQNWTDKRSAVSPSIEVEGFQEVEQGLVAFQTLLEYHTDIAFDFFEAWSLRNIFAVPPDLGVVLPHHEGLDLSIDRTQAEQREKVLADEIEELRNKIDNVCYYSLTATLDNYVHQQQLAKRQFKGAVRISSVRRRRAAQRLNNLLSHLPSSLGKLGSVPSKITDMAEIIYSIQPLEPPIVASHAQPPQPEVGRRPWESSKTGYVNWVIAKLVEKARELGKEGDVNNLQAGAEAVAKVEILKVALNELEAEQR